LVLISTGFLLDLLIQDRPITSSDEDSHRSYKNQSNTKPKKRRKTRNLDSGTETETETRPVLNKQALKLKQDRRIEAAGTAIMGRKSLQSKAYEAEIARLKKDLDAKDEELEEKASELEEKDTEIKGHEAKIGEMTSENKAVKARLQTRLAGLKRKHGNEEAPRTTEVAGMKFNEGMRVLVKRKTKREFWRSGKFLGNDTQLRGACDKIMLTIPDLAKKMKTMKGKELDDYKEGFFITYGFTVRHEINEHRSTVQSNLKTEYLLLIKNEGTIVTAEMIGKIIRREQMDYDPEDKEYGSKMRALFKWYWDHLLPKCAGNTHWSNNIRLHETIGKARIQNKDGTKGGKHITSSTEAYIILIFENSQPRWECERKLLAAGTKIDKAERAKKTYVGAKFSNSSSGNAKYGGWSAAGRNRFIDLMKAVTEAKSKPNVRAVEAFCLASLRLDKGIAKTESNRKKKTKCANTLEVEDTEVPFESEDEGSTTEEELELDDVEEASEAGAKDDDEEDDDEEDEEPGKKAAAAREKDRDEEDEEEEAPENETAEAEKKGDDEEEGEEDEE
jgi:hypothetical protein